MRESFILYTKINEVVKQLNDEEKGRLFQAILDYEETGEMPELEKLLHLVFIPIKQDLDKNNEKWEKQSKARSEAGKKGMASRYGKGKNAVKPEPEHIEDNGTSKDGDVVTDITEYRQDISNVIENEKPVCSVCQQTEQTEEVRIKSDFIENQFDKFWKIYPRKMNILNSQGEYVRLLETTQALSEEDLIAAAQNYAETCRIRNTKERYIKNPANWLRDSSWLDYLPGTYKKPQNNIEKPKVTKNRNQFNNIDSRTINFDELERSLLGVGV